MITEKSKNVHKNLFGSAVPRFTPELYLHAAPFRRSICSGAPIVLSGTGTAEDPYIYLTYSNDAVYYLANDIPLPSRKAWSVPAGFTGYFTSETAGGKDNSILRTSDTRLYSSGTVYYHNVYQMAAGIASNIRSTDYDAVEFGSGSIIMPAQFYNDTNSYVLASNFTSATSFDVTEYINVTSGGETVPAIVIRDYDQLKLVGLGEGILLSETVNEISRTKTVNYPADAVYYLANDITLDDDGWQLPDDFTGSFTCDPANAQTDSERLYERHTLSANKADVYIQNIYQLETLGLSDSVRNEEPVLDHDYDAEYFGTGSTIYLSYLSTDYLDYGKDNTYILSRTFRSERVDRISTTVLGSISNSSHINGRDYFGQTTAEVGGVTYILIGDRQQLDAIGTNKYVYGPVYKVTQKRSRITDPWEFDSAELVYPGDADLIENVAVNYDGTSVRDFSEASLFSAASYHAPGTVRISAYEREVYCASDGAGGYNVLGTASGANRGTQRYTTDANYIVFRNIDMNKTDKTDLTWNPLMFSGTMYGVMSEAPDNVSTLWSVGKTLLNIDSNRKPEISNLDVVPATLTKDGKTVLDLAVQTGVGFFGTLRGNYDSSLLLSDPAVVKNIRLIDGTVTNPAVGAGVDETIINDLLTGTGSLLGTVLDPVLSVLLGKNIGIETMLTSLLDARAKDASSNATGAFAGRIIGSVSVEDCEAVNMQVQTVRTDK